jgi:hypothetical protein
VECFLRKGIINMRNIGLLLAAGLLVSCGPVVHHPFDDAGTVSKTDSSIPAPPTNLEAGVVVADATVDVESGVDGGMDAGAVDSGNDALVPWCFPPDTGSQGISYNCGPVMLNNPNAPNVVFIFFGAWGNNTAPAILTTFMTNLASGTSPAGNAYLDIDSTYYSIPCPGCSPQYLSGKITFGGSYFLESAKISLSDSDLPTIIDDAITAFNLTLDDNTLYMVLTSPNISESIDAFEQFCSSFCGYHNSYPLNLGNTTISTIKYSFVGDPDNCPFACEPSQFLNDGGNYVSPNFNAGADSMISVISHELMEALTDPTLSSWYNSYQQEVGDLCSWKYGSNTYKTANGSTANINIGGNDYLIQQIWSNTDGGYCTMSK